MNKHQSSETYSIKNESSMSIVTTQEKMPITSKQSQTPSVQWITPKSINQLQKGDLILFQDCSIGHVHFIIESYCTIMVENCPSPIVLQENPYDRQKIKTLRIGDRRCCVPIPEWQITS